MDTNKMEMRNVSKGVVIWREMQIPITI